MPFDGLADARTRLSAGLDTPAARMAGRALLLGGTVLAGFLGYSAASSAMFTWGTELGGRLAAPKTGMWSHAPRWAWDAMTWWRYAAALRQGMFTPDVGNRVLRWLYGSAGAGAFPALIAYAIGREAVRGWGLRKLHGETSWATPRQIRRVGLRARHGIILGRDGRGILALGGQESVALYAPPRSGKTSGVAIPNAIAFGGSLVALDLRGEIHDATAGARAEGGQRVIRLEPYNEEGRTHRWNPLATVRRGTVDAYGDVERLSHQVIQDLPGQNNFFSKTARSGFTGVALMLSEDPDEALTLNAIARILVRPDVKAYLPARLDERRRAGKPHSQACADACRAFVQAPAETFSNIVSTIQSDLGVFLNPRVAAMTAASDFDMRELRRSLHAVYLVVHDKDLDALRPLTSLFFQQLVDTMTAVRPGPGKDCDPLSRHQVLMICDEFVRLGKVPRLAHANSFVGGYDMRIIYILQDRRQPEEHYGISGAKVLLNSCGVEMLFHTKDQDIAREVSERLGYDTVAGTSETKARAGGALASKASETVSDARRALLLPQEVTQLGEDEIILFRAGIPAVKAQRIKWWLDPAFAGAMRPAPEVPAIAVPYEMDKGSGAAEGDDAAIPSLSRQDVAVLGTLWLAAVPKGGTHPETMEQAKAAIDGFLATVPVQPQGRKPVPAAT